MPRPATVDHGPLILSFVARYQERYGEAPTYRKIAYAVGISSLDHVSRDIKQLQAQGKLTFLPAPCMEPSAQPTPRRRGVPAGRFRCSRCHIKIGERVGLCEPCEKNEPYIQTHLLLGEERFYQIQRPIPTGLGYEKETKRRTRRVYNRKVSE